MDWDNDGRTDVISGSWPGEIYLFRRQEDGRFGACEPLKNELERPVNVGTAAAAHAVDWNGDEKLDLLIGVIDGQVYFVPSHGRDGATTLGAATRLELNVPSSTDLDHSAPVVADWDGDGRGDLIVGAGDGSVWYFRNLGPAGNPQLAPGERLIQPSSIEQNAKHARKEGQWGIRVKICPTDFNGDGLLDLLMGDYGGEFVGRAPQTPHERAEDEAAAQRISKLRNAISSSTSASEKERLRIEMASSMEIGIRWTTRRHTHGRVWLWLREAR